MKRIILFRFHDYKEICENRIKILRKYNPDIPIYGLFGGSEEKFNEMKSLDLDDLYLVPLDDPYWKWLSGDLCARLWYKDFGHKVDFDMVHIVEWDLVFTKPISNIYKDFTDGVVLTNIESIEKRIKKGWTWVTGKRSEKEWERLQEFCKQKFNWDSEPIGGLFPATSMSKSFLEEYQKISVPSYCNDEVRVPIFAQSFGIKVQSIELDDKNIFNCNNDEITVEQVYSQLHKGHNIFHPVRKIIDIDKLAIDNK